LGGTIHVNKRKRMSNCTTTTGTFTVNVPMPTLTVSGPGITVSSGTGWTDSGTTYIDSYQIAISSFMVEMHANAIIQKEMDIARKKYPGVDWKRINDMLNSSDNEMRQLGLSTIGEYTKYLRQIFDCMHRRDEYMLTSIVNGYI
jgi:hypothetical protein